MEGQRGTGGRPLGRDRNGRRRGVGGASWTLRASTALGLSAFLALAAVSIAAGGSLHNTGCVASNDREGCQVLEHQRLKSADAVAVSPNGSSVYVGSYSSGTLSSFHRDQDGALTYQGCFADHGKHHCQEPAHSSLAHPIGIAVSPDGRSVYAATENDRESAVTIFERRPNGTLRYRGCFADFGTYHCDRPAHDSLADLTGVAVNPDGDSVYVLGSFDSNAITTFNRASDGSLAYAGCIGNRDESDERVRGCVKSKHPSLHEPEGIAVSPDGRSVYVGSDFGDAVTRFRQTRDGGLSYVGCVASNGRYGCRPVDSNSIDSVVGLAVSPDGRSLYTASLDHGAVARFDRGAHGGLTYRGCYSSGGIEASRDCRNTPRGTLHFAESVQVSPDGNSVYVGDDLAIVAFDRGRGGGLGYDNCYSDATRLDCREAPQFSGADDLAISPDGRSLYAAGYDSVGLFSRRIP